MTWKKRIMMGAVGMPCAGKGEAASVAEKKFGFRVFRFRDVVREEARKLGIDEGPLTLTKTGSLLRKLEGPAAIAKRVAIKLKKMREKRIFVEGIRSYPEIRLLKREFPNLYSIGIVSPKRVRLARALERKRRDDPMTPAQLEKKDRVEASWGVPRALARSDILINNDSGDISGFRRLVAGAIKHIL